MPLLRFSIRLFSSHDAISLSVKVRWLGLPFFKKSPVNSHWAALAYLLYSYSVAASFVHPFFGATADAVNGIDSTKKNNITEERNFWWPQYITFLVLYATKVKQTKKSFCAFIVLRFFLSFSIYHFFVLAYKIAIFGPQNYAPPQ